MKSKYMFLTTLALLGILAFFLIPTTKAEEGVPETEDTGCTGIDYLENPIENSEYITFGSSLPSSYYINVLGIKQLDLGLRDCCIRDDIVEVWLVPVSGPKVKIWTLDSCWDRFLDPIFCGPSGTHLWKWYYNIILPPCTKQLELRNTVSSVGPSGWYYDTHIDSYYNSPVADAGGPYIGYEGTPITFDASGSYDPDGSITTYQWDFDYDGTYDTTTSSSTTTHTYNDNKLQYVRLRVIDGQCLTNIDLATVTVLNVAPTLTLGGDPDVNEGSSYTLILDSSDPGTDTITSWNINWGDGSAALVTGNPSSVTYTYADGPNAFTISATATDEDGTFSAAPLTMTVKNVAPIPTILGPLEDRPEDISFYFSATSFDPCITDDPTFEWDFGEGLGWEDSTLNPQHTYFYPGEYWVLLRVTDKDGDAGTTAPFKITVLDTTPPETTLELGCHYFDEFGTTYVTSSTPFTLEVTDDSDIAYTKYSINGVEFGYGGPFTLSGPDGIYEVSFYSEDIAGNKETPPLTHPLEFFLVSLKENSWLTDSDDNPISYFDFIFRKDNKLGGFTLVATNPGQFYYHIEVVNDWPIAIEMLTIQAILPPEFILKGAMPIHVYLGGVDITGSCTIDPTTGTVTVLNVPVGGIVYITVHMDFGEKGRFVEDLGDFILQGYIFNTEVVGKGETPDEGLCATHYSSSKLIGHQKKSTGICGFVTDTDGNPCVDVEVYLYAEDGIDIIAITETDVNGFYYFFELDLPTYKVSIGPIDTAIVIMVVTVKKDEFTEANLLYEDP